MTCLLRQHLKAVVEWRTTVNQVKTSEGLQAYITEIAEKHGVDLSEGTSNLRLVLPNSDHLIVEVTGKIYVTVGHFQRRDGRLVPTRQMKFYTMQMAAFEKPKSWIPVAIAEGDGEWQWIASIDNLSTGNICSVDLPMQEAVAKEAEEWLDIVRAQGWLGQATRKTTTVVTALENYQGE